MYNLSETDKTIWLNGVKNAALTITFLGTGEILEIDSSKITSLQIDKKSISISAVELGSAIASEMAVSLYNAEGEFSAYEFAGAEIYCVITATAENGTQAELPMGYFTVDSSPKDRSTLELSALDRMARFDKYIDLETVRSWFPAAKAEDIISNLCNVADVPLGTCENLVNTDVLFEVPDEFTEGDEDEESEFISSVEAAYTYRDILGWICAACGVCAYIGRDGKLYTRWYDTSVADIDIDESMRFSGTHDRNVYITGLITESGTYGTSDYAIDVSSNPFFRNLDDEHIANVVKQACIEYYPYDATILPAAWMDLFDCVDYIDSGTAYKSIITGWNYTLNGSLVLSASAQDDATSGYATLSAKTAVLYTWIAYADDEQGTGISVNPDGKKYIGVATNRTLKNVDISNPGIFTWSLYSGEDGVTILHTSVVYAISSDATQPTDDEFTHTTLPDAAIGSYIWNKCSVVYSDGNTMSWYSVSRVGEDGEQGTPGATGEDGKTTYLHIAYASSADGKEDFSRTYFEGAAYMGTCTDYNEDDPTIYSSYTWARIKGDDGTGVSIVTQYTVYQQGESGTEIPTGEWKTEIEGVTQGSFLWTKNYIAYSDGSEMTSYSVAYEAIDGEDGSKTYLESGTPSADNYPANEWVDASTQEKHVGDIYFDEDTGYTYRWSESNGEYSWVIIKDDDISANQQALQDALDKAMSELEQKIAALEAIVDNTIETWFEAGEPTLDNYPASEWTDDETKAKHVGDLYYDSNNGYCYRFTMNTTTGVFSWVLIQDNDVTEALSELHDAIEAQEKLTEEFNQFREETDAAIAELPTTILSEASETFATKTETAEMESSLSASIATNAAGLESLASRVDTAEDELNGISETYATKSELTQTASEISTKVSSVESVANSAIGSAVEALEKATGNEVDISNLAMILQKAGYYNLLEGTSSEWSDWYELRTTDTNNYTVPLYSGYDMSYFTEGSTLTFGFDIEFYGVEEGTAGTFTMYSQDSWYIDGGTTVWKKGPCHGAMTITSAPEDGVYHYSNTTTYTTDYSGYDYFRFSIRNDYTTGGKFRVRNVMLTPTSTEVSWAPAKADIIEALDKAAGNEVNISDLAVRMTEAESSITQNAESITLAVSEQQALQNALSDDISNLELTSDAIRLFCRQFLTDEEYDEVKDDISALFEVTAGEIMSKFSSLWITESDEGLRIGRDGSTLQSLQDNDSYEFIDTNTDTAVVTLDTTGLTATRVGAQQFELMDGSAKQWAIRKGATVSGTGSGLDIVWIGG